MEMTGKKSWKSDKSGLFQHLLFLFFTGILLEMRRVQNCYLHNGLVTVIYSLAPNGHQKIPLIQLLSYLFMFQNLELLEEQKGIF